MNTLLCHCRYNAASNADKAPTGSVGNSFPRDDRMETTKKEFHNIQTSGNPTNHRATFAGAASNNIDVCYTTGNAFTNHVVFNKSVTASTVQQLYPASAFHPVKNDLFCAPQQVKTDNGGDEPARKVLAQLKGAHEEHHTRHLYIRYDNYQVHHLAGHGMQQQQPTDHNDFSLKKLATAAPHCGSSNVLSGPVEGNTGIYSINRSGSGSNHGSNAAINIGGTNVESDHGGSGKSGSGDASGSGRADDYKSALREAALTKFHQKKKERCFHKRVTETFCFRRLFCFQRAKFSSGKLLKGR